MTSVTASAENRLTLALKEWGAVVHALLQGRQHVLLRKGGIHEKRFDHALGDWFVIMPTVAHSHAERVRPEHADLLPAGAADVNDEQFTVRCGLRLIDAVAVDDPEMLPRIRDLHIWTDESVQTDRVEFRPKHPVHVLVVQAFELPTPVDVTRIDAYGGCRSWLDLPVPWNGQEGLAVVDTETLDQVADRVRRTVGKSGKSE